MNNSDPKVKLSKAIKHFGGARPLAKYLEVSPEAIYKRVRAKKIYMPTVTAYRLAVTHPELVEVKKQA